MNAPARLPVKGPPAIWAAFAAQGRWKNWVIVAQLMCNGIMAVAFVGVVTRQPDVVVVGEDGSGTYVPTLASTKALQDFLREQRAKPTDITLLSFTQRFVRLTAGVNSTTIDESWAEALDLMTAPLAAKMKQEAASQKLLETYRLASMRSTLQFTAAELVERRGEKSHVRVRVSRTKEKLTGGGVSEDALQVDLVLVEVPRSRLHPDGLEVFDWHSAPVSTGSAAATAETPSVQEKQ